MKGHVLLPMLALALAACNETTPPTGPAPGPAPRFNTTTITEASAPSGTHYQVGEASCSVSGLSVSCVSYELAGVGNANATAALQANYHATVDCRNHGKQVVEVKAQLKAAGVTTGELEPKNGRLEVPALSTGALPSDGDFIDAAVCPNGNWTKEIRDGTKELGDFTYTLTFTGFTGAYITITGP